MSTKVAPGKIEELANELKNYSRCVESGERSIYQTILRLIEETEAEYSESYVRSTTHHIRQMLHEMRRSADKVTGELNTLSRNSLIAASRYRDLELKQAVLRIPKSGKIDITPVPIPNFSPENKPSFIKYPFFSLNPLEDIIKSGDKIKVKPKFDPNKDYAALIREAIKNGDYSNLQTLVDERDAKIASNRELYKEANATGEDLLSYGYVGVRSFLNTLGFTDDQITYENGKVCVTVNGKKYPLDILGVAITGYVNYASKENIEKALKNAGVNLNPVNSSTSTTSGDITPPPADYDTVKKIQHYLVQLGFDIGIFADGTPMIDGDCGNRTIAAILVLQNSVGIDITGQPDEQTLNKLIELVESGKKYGDIFKAFVPSEHPVVVLDKELNGHLPEEEAKKLFRVRANNGGYALMQKSEAIAWAYLVNEVVTQTDFNVNKFFPSYSTTGYREYKDQVRFYAGYYLKQQGYSHSHNAAIAAVPQFDIGLEKAKQFIWEHREDFSNDQYFFDKYVGKPGDNNKYLSGYGSSNHGNGVALDLDLQDPGSDKGGKGYATTAEVRWLEKNAGRFGFKPYLAKPDKIKKDGIMVNNYAETWHWNYQP